ncbi:hypothetical protein CF326_g6101, partial [Tilletia indica]
MEGILRKQLKDFQRSFVAQHGRPPSKSDMAKEPGIQSAYDAWHAIRKVSSSSTQAEASSSKSGTASTSASRVFTTPSRKSRTIAPQPTTTAATPTPTSTRKKNPFATPSSAAA